MNVAISKELILDSDPWQGRCQLCGRQFWETLLFLDVLLSELYSTKKNNYIQFKFGIKNSSTGPAFMFHRQLLAGSAHPFWNLKVHTSIHLCSTIKILSHSISYPSSGMMPTFFQSYIILAFDADWHHNNMEIQEGSFNQQTTSSVLSCILDCLLAYT